MEKITKQLASELVETANALADAAAPVTLKYFRKLAHAENKDPTGFDPVTIADRQAEQAMRAVLQERRPLDGIFGEEFGETESQSGLTWVLDPIDGTRGYISGTPTWGTLIAVNSGAEPLFGIIDQPFTRERFQGGFGHADYVGPVETGLLATSSKTSLKDATIFTTFPEVGTEAEASAFHKIANTCKLTRYGMDCYAYALLAAGQIELVVEAGLSAYDIQGPLAVIVAAGGAVTDWQGRPAHNGGRVLAAANPTLHKKALRMLENT